MTNNDCLSPRAKKDTAAPLATPTIASRHRESQDVLSFEGSTEEVLRYTIVAKVSNVTYVLP